MTDEKVYGGHKYLLFTGLNGGPQYSWTQAAAYCQSIGGHLATINNAEENEFLHQMSGEREIWIGINDLWNKQNHVWDGNPAGSSYTNWAYAQPDNYKGTQRFGALTFDGTWDDRFNTDVLAFICEFDNYCDHEYYAESYRGTCLENRIYHYVCRLCGEEYEEALPDDYTPWSETVPEDVNNNQIESAVQYRVSKLETTTSSASSLEGWQNAGTTTVYSDWSAWSAWTTGSASANELTDVETAKLFRYYCFYCPVCGGREPFQGMSDCNQYSLTLDNGQTIWSPVAYSASNPQRYSYTTAKYYTESLGDGLRWNFSSGNLNDTAVGTPDYGYTEGSVIENGYRTRTRTKSTVNVFQRWSDWSSWSNTEAVANDQTKVESRTVYRVNNAPKGDHQWDDGVIVEEATHQHAGKKVFTCSVCQSTNETVIPKLSAKNITDVSVLATSDSYVYTGLEIQPEVVLKDGTYTLKEGKDYTLSYSQNIHAGTGKIIISGIGDYQGSLTKEFTISKAEQTLVLSPSEKEIELMTGQFRRIVLTGAGNALYKTTDSSVVSVDASGMMKALEPGSAVILVRFSGNEDYLEAEAMIIVRVVENAEQIDWELLDLEIEFAGRLNSSEMKNWNQSSADVLSKAMSLGSKKDVKQSEVDQTVSQLSQTLLKLRLRSGSSKLRSV